MKKCVIVLCGIILMTMVGQVLAEIAIPPNYQISSPSSQLQNEEMIWVCPTDSNIVIADWRDFRLGYRRIGLGRSIDGGNTWTDSLVTVRYYNRQSDPTMDVDRQGNFYLSMLDYASGGPIPYSAITMLRSTDKGLSWPTMAKVEYPVQIFFEDKQYTVIDRTGGPYDGNIYMAWARFNNNDDPNMMMFVRSTDFDLGFDEPVIIGPPIYDSACGSTIWGGQFIYPIVGSDGTIYCFWNRTTYDTLCNGYYSISKVVSEDGGQTFTDPEVVRITYGNYQAVDGGVNVYNAPMSAADITGGPFDGNLYIAYANMDISNTTYYDFNVEFIKSSDKGQTWSEPIYINDDIVGPEAVFDQFHPWLFCNEEGVLMVLFYDQRIDTAFHYSFDAFAAYSFDGGESFTTNHRISEFSIFPAYLKSPEPDISLGGQTDSRSGLKNPATRAGLIAEYIGITAYHDQINAIWTDTRTGNQDAYGANWLLPILRPRLFGPADGDTLSGSVDFDWATAWKMDDDTYRLEIADDAEFASIVYAGLVDTTGLAKNLDSIGYGDYYWRVKAFKVSTGDSSESSEIRQFFSPNFICGDINQDELVNIFDVTGLIDFLYRDGEPPVPMESGDINNDGLVNIFDVTGLIDFLYRDGAPPECPTL